jgi:hypothetical protein
MSPLSVQVVSPVDSSSIEQDGEDISGEENGNIVRTSSIAQNLVDSGNRSGSRDDNSSDTISLGLYDSKGISDSVSTSLTLPNPPRPSRTQTDAREGLRI